MSEALEKYVGLAAVLHLHGIACPGPRDGMVLTGILGQLDEVIQAPATPPSVRAAFQKYYDGLLTVAGIWVVQQRLIINRVESAVLAGNGPT